MIRPRTKAKNNLTIIFLIGLAAGLIESEFDFAYSTGTGLGVLALSIILAYPISYLIKASKKSSTKEPRIQLVSYIGIFISITVSAAYLLSRF